MATRKFLLSECKPEWRNYNGKDGGPRDAIGFECPEGHESCYVIIPFTPALDGSPQPVQQRNGAQWSREGDTFENLTLQPSIRTIPTYQNATDALAKGALKQYLTERMYCRLHIFIRNGRIEFCGDSG